MIKKPVLSTNEIQAMFNWKRQQVFATAKRENWRRFENGTDRQIHYAAEDVITFQKARQRTALYIKVAYLSGRSKLLRSKELDTTCPVCGQFAIRFPLPHPVRTNSLKIRMNTSMAPHRYCVNEHITPDNKN